jgi:hypothetical protein
MKTIIHKHIKTVPRRFYKYKCTKCNTEFIFEESDITSVKSSSNQFSLHVNFFPNLLSVGKCPNDECDNQIIVGFDSYDKDNRTFIKSVKEITYDEYMMLKHENDY